MPLRTVFLGTPAFAVKSLEALVQAGITPELVVTRPDRPRGRGLKLFPSDVHAAAAAMGLPVAAPEKFHAPEFLESLRALAPELFVIVAYGVILKPEALKIPRLGSINLHASLLPRWRGVAPIAWQILAGDAHIGVTTQWIDAGVDTGGVIERVSQPAPRGITTGGLTELLAGLGAELIVRSVRAAAAGQAPGVPQDEALATFAPKFSREQGRLDWAQDSALLERQARAFHPWPSLRFELPSGPVKVLAAELADGTGTPGTVLSLDPAGVCVACGTGALRLLRVQPASRPGMGAAEWARGRGIVPGTHLGTAAS